MTEKITITINRDDDGNISGVGYNNSLSAMNSFEEMGALVFLLMYNVAKTINQDKENNNAQ